MLFVISFLDNILKFRKAGVGSKRGLLIASLLGSLAWLFGGVLCEAIGSADLMRAFRI